MRKSYDESKHVRNQLGQYADKTKESKPGEIPMTDRERVFATTYATADDAFNAAVETQEAQDTFILSHDADGYHMADDTTFFSEDKDATLRFNEQGIIADEYFEGDAPQAYERECEWAGGWQDDMRQLDPVRDFLDGDASRVRLYTVIPHIERENGDGEWEECDDPYFYVCADNPDTDRHHSEDEAARRRSQFERQIAATLEREYSDPNEALQAAVSVQDYTDGGGVGLHRTKDGTYTLSDDVEGHAAECSLEYDADYNMVEEPEFGSSVVQPDEYRLMDDYQQQRWEDMGPVKDFLNGKSNGVNIYTVAPSVYVEPADARDADDGPWLDTDATVYLMCADRLD